MESEDLTPTKTVRTHIFEVIEEFHEMEQSGTLSPIRRDREIVTLDTTDLSESDVEDTEIVVLDATDISDQESDESDGGWMCALCKAVFATTTQWNDHWDDTCLAPTTPPPRRDKNYCHTCRTVFNSKESNDRHEPCPEEERESETRAVRVAKKSCNTKSLIDQILCRYCKEHCKTTVHDPHYERTDCPPKISDQEQSRRRRTTTPKDTPDAHSNACPGLSEVGTGGSCTSHRHLLNPPNDTGNEHL
jgi:hypothetical protein